jgi:hypothetical protein
LNEIERIFE